MTTATPSREAGDALQDEEIARKLAAEMPLVKAHYEHPVTRTGGEQVRYAHAHIRTDVYEAIFNQYCPRIPLASLPTERRQGISTEVLTPKGREWRVQRWDMLQEEVRIEGDGEHETGEVYQRDFPDRGIKKGDPKTRQSSHSARVHVPDPDVIWIGRISDGLAWLGIVESRKLFKSMLHESSGQTDGQVEFLFRRDGRTTRWGDVIVDQEPGEIVNSPSAESLEFLRGGQGRQIDWRPSGQLPPWDAKIATDPEFGLHFLKRGDEVIIRGQGGWPKPRSPEFEMRWVLRPPSEGSSFVPQARDDQGVETIGRVRQRMFR